MFHETATGCGNVCSRFSFSCIIVNALFFSFEILVNVVCIISSVNLTA